MIDIHKKIFKIFKGSVFEIKADVIDFQYSENMEDQLIALRIEYENIRYKTISVEKENLPIKIYSEFNSYLRLTEIKSNDEVLILNIGNLPYSLINNITFVNFEEEPENYFFQNTISFKEFIEFLKSQEVDTEEAFHFVDYLNDISRKIVFTSLTDKGRLIIKYYNEIFHFNEKINLNNYLENFKNCFVEQNHHLPKFLKSSIIEYASRYDANNRINNVFGELNDITNNAKINFEIYLNNLSIDKIRKEYDEYKSKYFKDVSEILNNLTQKIIGLPILIATTLFAVEKVKENSIFLILLIIVIIITNIYLILLLKINFNDLSYIDAISNQDFKGLKENNFFTKYPKELEIFTKIKSRITARVNHLELITESYFWILGITNIIMIGFIFSYLNLNLTQIFIISFALLFILAISRNSVLNNVENKSVA
ncbi:hypothetical protein EV144_1011421 [Flavobacterium sp. 270]|uniref:hypothetical protein n=1 Tax=Flavobacterium sp. 270 TaxID=2512114 RepID=UPI0010648F4A|nr:hypothetical protein [Flavobacterium sp. 270]TDW52729.1 hypothetical protein EV144_1011421 [Flavobacterium sp. 270]